MIIALDIDNTLISHNSVSYKIANFFPHGHTNRKLKFKQIQFGERHNDNLIVKLISSILRLNDKSKYNLNMDLILLIKYLKSKGHNFVILSSRPDWDCLNVILYDALKTFGIQDSSIILECSNKVLYLKNNNISLLIDSSKKISTMAKLAGINSIDVENNFINQSK